MRSKKPSRYSDGTFSVSEGKNYRVNQVEVPFRPINDPRFRETAAAALAQANRVGSLTPSVGLPTLAAVRCYADKLEYFAVINARWLGWSWSEIGECLGISKQVLHRRYAVAAPRLRRRYHHPSPFSQRFRRGTGIG